MINNSMALDRGTEALASYIKAKGISVLNIAKSTGISNSKLQRSFGDDRRALRTDEFLMICKFLEIDPMKFFVPPNTKKGA